MVKLADKKIEAEDLEEFVKKYDGFGLELYVYSEARNLGFDTNHGGSYVDKVTGRTRQFDIQATAILPSGLRVMLAIECKYLQPNFPLLINRIPRLASESFNHRILPKGTYGEGGQQIIYAQLRVETSQGAGSLYSPNSYVGKSTVQVGYTRDQEMTSNDSEIFEKWGQALSSANQLVQKAAAPTAQNSFPVKSLIIPMLVVSDDNLWVADFAENGSVQKYPYRVDATECFVGEVYNIDGSPYQYKISHMHVVTKKGAVELLQKIKSGALFNS